MHSLGRFSKRTTRHRLPTRSTVRLLSGRCEWDLVCLVVLSLTEFRPYCTALFGVLCSVRSRYLFAIGLKTYLVLADDVCRIHEEFPIPDTLELTHGLVGSDTGLSPCITLCSKRLQRKGRGVRVSPYTTLPEGFGLDCVAFTRGY